MPWQRRPRSSRFFCLEARIGMMSGPCTWMLCLVVSRAL